MIRITQLSSSNPLEYQTNTLLSRMLNPFCGIVQEIGFIKRNKFGDKILTAGADITGVHTLLDKEDPGRGAYHTGGAGIYLNEPVIKSLGETVERYAQLVSELTLPKEMKFATFKQMAEKYDNILPKDYLDLYNNFQLSKEGFPYQKFNEELPLSWIKVKKVDDQKDSLWVPAQLLLVGYHIKSTKGEPWYSTAVTTGTAAHTDRASALLNSILEIIQVDSAMGHWYSNYDAPEIILDERTEPFQQILNKYGNKQGAIRFFWLKNPDLLGFSIACVLEKPEGVVPRVSVGLGASTHLNDALYKAYLEATGVSYLSNVLILKEKINNPNGKEINPDSIYDIDTNVAFYGKGKNYNKFSNRFNGNSTILSSEMDKDIVGAKEEQLEQLISSFSNSDKEVLHIDLTNIEASELGFYVTRLWCKDTLSLCFPSAPPINHPRFKKYGGFAHNEPHPYP